MQKWLTLYQLSLYGLVLSNPLLENMAKFHGMKTKLNRNGEKYEFGCLLAFVKACYVGTMAFLRADGEIFKELPTDEGVRQACALSHILFNFVIGQIMKTLDKYKVLAISPTLWITDFDYADDVDILAESVT